MKPKISPKDYKALNLSGVLTTRYTRDGRAQIIVTGKFQKKGGRYPAQVHARVGGTGISLTSKGGQSVPL